MIQIGESYTYKELCAILNQKNTTGEAKQKQLRNWSQNFSWIRPVGKNGRTSQKFQITNILVPPEEFDFSFDARHNNQGRPIGSENYEFFKNVFMFNFKNMNAQKLTIRHIFKITGLQSDNYYELDFSNINIPFFERDVNNRKYVYIIRYLNTLVKEGYIKYCKDFMIKDRKATEEELNCYNDMLENGIITETKVLIGKPRTIKEEYKAGCRDFDFLNKAKGMLIEKFNLNLDGVSVSDIRYIYHITPIKRIDINFEEYQKSKKKLQFKFCDSLISYYVKVKDSSGKSKYSLATLLHVKIIICEMVGLNSKYYDAEKLGNNKKAFSFDLKKYGELGLQYILDIITVKGNEEYKILLNKLVDILPDPEMTGMIKSEYMEEIENEINQICTALGCDESIHYYDENMEWAKKDGIDLIEVIA